MKPATIARAFDCRRSRCRWLPTPVGIIARPTIGAPERLASEIGSYLPLPRTRADRERTGDGRKSIAERYTSLEDYLGRISLAAVELVRERFLLAEDVPSVIERAKAHYEWATR